MNILSTKQKFGIIGTNPKINNAIEIALRVASTDLSVLVCGESGVGKEFFPQIIHSNSSRKHANYIAVNCGAIPEGTIDSELFGHEKGSFTGATENRKGYFEMANGGTIFLDEVAELPQTTQVRLLRVLQAGEFMKVGSSKVQKTDVRVVAATNVDIPSAIKNGNFREDLYYRLNTVPISVPALRERKEDIHLLFRKFCSDIASKYSMPVIKLTPDAKTELEDYRWPGNIRQLKNIAEQISVIEQEREISAEILEKYLPGYSASASPAIYSNNPQGDDSFRSERDILYKVLYDLKSDIIELKEMVKNLQSKSYTQQSPQESFLPSLSSQELAQRQFPSTYIEDNDRFDPAVEINEDDLTEKDRFQKEQIVKALKKHKGKRKEAANELYISERTLYRKIKELDINE